MRSPRVSLSFIVSPHGTGWLNKMMIRVRSCSDKRKNAPTVGGKPEIFLLIYNECRGVRGVSKRAVEGILRFSLRAFLL